MTREIRMSGRKGRGLVALVDDDVFEAAARYTWNAALGYATRGSGDGGVVYMHRWILGLAKGDRRVVHHINEDRLDNRRQNLAICRDRMDHAGWPHPKRDAACAEGGRRAAEARERFALIRREFAQ